MTKIDELTKAAQHRVEKNGFKCDDCDREPAFIVIRGDESRLVCSSHRIHDDNVTRWFNHVWRVWEKS